MITNLTNAGEEVHQKAVWATDEITLPATVDFLLYNDATDLLDDTADDPSTDVTTEPSDGNYTRKTLTIDGSAGGDGLISVSQSGGAWRAEVPTLTWDVDGTTGTVDAYAVVMLVALDGDGAPANHIITGGALSDSRVLDPLPAIDTNGGVLTID